MTDSSMIGRIAAACSVLNLSEAALDQWVESAERWGVRSPAALGCLLALVREAWGPDVHLMESEGPKGGSMVIVDGPQLKFKADGGTLAERRVAALEAAPQPGTRPRELSDGEADAMTRIMGGGL